MKEFLIEYGMTFFLGLTTAGVTAIVKMSISLRRDVKDLLKINRLQTANIGTLNNSSIEHIKATRSHNYALREVIRDDCGTASQSVESAKSHIEKSEDILMAQNTANTQAAMAVGS